MINISKTSAKTTRSLQFNQSGPASDFLTVKEVATYLRVSKDTVYRMLDARAITFLSVAGCKRIRCMDLEAYIKNHRVLAHNE